MVALKEWAQRPIEERNLFNPPFLCSLTQEFVREFGKTDASPIMLVSIALTASLHGGTRSNLPYSVVTSLYEWLQDHENLLVEFSSRARNLMPHVREAIVFGLSYGSFEIRPDGTLGLTSKRALFSKLFLDETTPETKDIIIRTKFMGRWFSKSGSEASICAAWAF